MARYHSPDRVHGSHGGTHSARNRRHSSTGSLEAGDRGDSWRVVHVSDQGAGQPGGLPREYRPFPDTVRVLRVHGTR